MHAHARRPALELGGLRIWEQGRHFPWEADFWDANWIEVKAECQGPQARVRVEGPYLHAGDLVRWARDCRRLLSGGATIANLWGVKPELQIQIQAREEAFRAEVRLSPDLESQEHLFRFQVGGPEILAFALALDELAESYPVHPARVRKGPPARLGA